MRRLCKVKDVQRVFNTVGRFTDAEIETEIEDATIDIYQECGDPIAATISVISKNNNSSDGSFYSEYYLGEKRISYTERVFVGTATKRELTETTDFTIANNTGMLKFTTSTVGGSRLDISDSLIVYYVPSLYARYCALRVSESLLEKMDIMSGGVTSKELLVVRNKLEKQEQLINNRMGILMSSDYKYYNENYGINMKTVKQDHDANQYIYRTDGVDD